MVTIFSLGKFQSHAYILVERKMGGTSPKIPLLGIKNVNAQQEVGDGVGQDGGEEVLAAIEQADVDKAGDDARHPVVVLQAEGQGDSKEGEPGEAEGVLQEKLPDYFRDGLRLQGEALLAQVG